MWMAVSAAVVATAAWVVTESERRGVDVVEPSVTRAPSAALTVESPVDPTATATEPATAPAELAHPVEAVVGATLVFELTGGVDASPIPLDVLIEPVVDNRAMARVKQRTATVRPGAPVVLEALDEGPHRVDLRSNGVFIAGDEFVLHQGVNTISYDVGTMYGAHVHVHDETGAPVEGAEVALVAMNVDVPRAELVTDARGEAVLRPLPAHGEYMCEVSADGFAETRIGPFLLCPEQRCAVVDIALRSGGVVCGVVVESDGSPIAGAAVELSGRDLGRESMTDEHGRFEFDGLPYRPLAVGTAPAGRAETARLVEPVHPDHVIGEGVTLVARPIGWVSGRAVYEDGTPCDSLRLYALSTDAEVARARAGYQVASEPDGSFVVGPVPVGEVRLLDLDTPGFERIVHTGDEVELVLPKSQRRRLTLQFVDAIGRPVIDEVNYAIRDGRTTFGPLVARPDENGTLDVLLRTSSRTVDVDLTVSGFRRTKVEAIPVACEEPVTVALTPGSVFAVEVMSEDGSLLSDARILLRWPDTRDQVGWAPPPYPRAESYVGPDGLLAQITLSREADGLFRIAPYQREDLTYTAFAPGHVPQTGDVATLPGTIALRRQRIEASR